MPRGKCEEICGPVRRSMRLRQKRLGITNNKKENELLPDDLMIEILSWLPPVFVMRCKCVCKLWCSIIQDRKFIEKHRDRGQMETVNLDIIKSEFEYMFVTDGLWMEFCRASGIYRIRNHATNRILELPNPEEKRRLALCMVFIPPTNDEYKAVFVYRKGKTDIGMKVLTVGIGLKWRDVQIPFSCIWPTAPSSALLGGFFFITNIDKPDLEQYKMFSFDVEDESFKEILMPESMFLFSGFRSPLFIWDHKLALGCLVKEVLHIWILVDWKKSMWDQRRIVFPSNAIKKYPGMIGNATGYAVNGNLLTFSIDNKQTKLTYDIRNQKVVSVVVGAKGHTVNIRPSIVTLKGMQ